LSVSVKVLPVLFPQEPAAVPLSAEDLFFYSLPDLQAL
jgi:hypothetical protein